MFLKRAIFDRSSSRKSSFRANKIMSNTKSCACGSSPGEKGVKGGVKPQSIDGGDLPCMSKVGQAKTWEIRSRGESVTQQDRPPRSAGERPSSVSWTDIRQLGSKLRL